MNKNIKTALVIATILCVIITIIMAVLFCKLFILDKDSPTGVVTTIAKDMKLMHNYSSISFSEEDDYKGIKYKYNTDYETTYMKFDNNDEAQIVYDQMKNDDYNVIEEGYKYFIGWNYTASDANIKEKVELDRHVIVCTILEVEHCGEALPE